MAHGVSPAAQLQLDFTQASVIIVSWRRLLYLLGLVVGLTIFVWQVWGSFTAARQSGFAIANGVALGGALSLYLLATVLQMAAWAVIMRYLNVQLGALHVLQGYLLTFLPRYIPGTVWGYLSRNEWLAQEHGVGYTTSTVASLLETSTFVLTALSICVVYWGHAYAGSATLSVLIVGICLMGLWLNWWGMLRVPQWIRWRRLQAWPIAHGNHWLWLVGNLLCLLFWGVHGLALMLLQSALGAEVSISAPSAIFTFALSWVTGFLIVVIPAGLGVREVALATLLGQEAAIAPSEANILAILARVGIVVAELLMLVVGVYLRIEEWRHERTNFSPDPKSQSAVD